MEHVSPRRLLTVDASPNITRSIASFFSSQGYAVYKVNQSKHVLSTIKSERIEVVCLDIDMPGTTGLAILKEIRATGLPVAVIMMAGRTTLTHRIASFRYGADFLFLKTVQHETDLAKLVEFCLRRLDEWRFAIRTGPAPDNNMRHSIPPVERENDVDTLSLHWRPVRRNRSDDTAYLFHCDVL